MLNHCHPLPPRWPWRWIGPRSGATAAPKVPACFNKTSIQFFVDKLRRNERDGSTSSSSLHDSSSGSRHGPWSCNHDFRLNELRAAKEPRSRLACCPFRANNFHLRVSTTRHRAFDPPSSHPLAAKTQPEHSQSTTRAQPERIQSAARAQSEHRQRAQPERSQSTVRVAARAPPMYRQSTARAP